MPLGSNTSAFLWLLRKMFKNTSFKEHMPMAASARTDKVDSTFNYLLCQVITHTMLISKLKKDCLHLLNKHNLTNFLFFKFLNFFAISLVERALSIITSNMALSDQFKLKYTLERMPFQPFEIIKSGKTAKNYIFSFVL